MGNFDYRAPADLFRARNGRHPEYRRFDTAAEAIRYAVEQIPSRLLDGTIMETDGGRVPGSRIRELYESDEFPLTKR